MHEIEPSKLLIPVAIALLLLLGFYGYLLHEGLPQKWTAESSESATVLPETHGEITEKNHPPYTMIIPFAALLLCIAILPLIPATAQWWESNLNKFIVAASLGVLTLLYYGFLSNFTLVGEWVSHHEVPATASAWEKISVIFMNAIVVDFIPFIVLLFSLFTITGGIRIGSNIKGTPLVNSTILLIGAILASFIGTTGAAVLLIRPLLEMNKGRIHKVHTIVIFIFCVCNCGGCLTPLGDPPLFLGYLRGIDFAWTLNLWREWAFINLSLITFYFLWDFSCFYWRESKEYRKKNAAEKTHFTLTGWKMNGTLLLGVVGAVAFLDPSKTIPGTDWHPWFYLREAVQLGLAAMSLLFSSYHIRKENAFNFLAICEVAVLFFGIFICMQAPLQILNKEGKNLVAFAEAKTGASKPTLFFWSSGSLSSVLDNAPTYVTFFETAKALSPTSNKEKEEWLKEEGREFRPVPIGMEGKNGYIDFYLLVAVALGSVFMGAMTYIGNGPNFMIKAIAEQDGVKMPSFFGYMLYSCLILLPLLVMMTFLFL